MCLVLSVTVVLGALLRSSFEKHKGFDPFVLYGPTQLYPLYFFPSDFSSLLWPAGLKGENPWIVIIPSRRRSNSG